MPTFTLINCLPIMWGLVKNEWTCFEDRPRLRSAQRQTAERRRSPPWSPAWWCADTDVWVGPRSKTWPDPAALRETQTGSAIRDDMTNTSRNQAAWWMCVCVSNRWRLQERAPRCLCRGTGGRHDRRRRRTGLSQSPPSCPRSSGTGTSIGSVRTWTAETEDSGCKKRFTREGFRQRLNV